MKKRAIIAISLLLLLTTITSQQTIIITKLKLKQINIENNILVAEDDLKKLLAPIYERNLIFLSYIEIERILMQNSFIESFEIKKIYPNTLKIRIFEKKPIAILVDKKKKYLLSDKIDLIDYQILKINKNLPMVVGKQKDFKILYSNLKNIDFPFDMISKLFFSELIFLISLPSKNLTPFCLSLKVSLSIINFGFTTHVLGLQRALPLVVCPCFTSLCSSFSLIR